MARRRLLAVLAGAVLLASCVAPPERDIRLEWLDATPAGVVPAALAAVASDLVAAGTDAIGEAPAVVLQAGGTVPLVPSEPYAASARIVSAASAGGVLYLIGGRAGGAHGNTRWTVWDGTVAGPVTSRPQEFFTFGGQDAGPLLGTVIVGDSVQATDAGVVQTPAVFVGTVGGEWRRIDLPVPTQMPGLRRLPGRWGQALAGDRTGLLTSLLVSAMGLRH